MAGGRIDGLESPGGMVLARAASALTAAFTLAALGGCPQLETPLATVTGRIEGASAGAFVYPLGRPDLKAAVGSDGAYRIDGVPTSVDAFVLFDGVPLAGRAELVLQPLRGGEENRIADRFGSGAAVDEATKMPLAGTVVAATSLDGGALPAALSFSVAGTDQTAIPPDGGEEEVATLYPLPGGDFELLAAAAGFVERRGSASVLAGATVLLQLSLEIDTDAEAPGCAASGLCEHDLHCSDLDGRCYACISSGDCDAGEHCEVAVGLCQSDVGIAGATCAACQGDGGCATGICVIEPSETTGYCSVACGAPTDCPAGFACGAGGRCEAPAGCDDWLQTMTSTCVDDAPCADDLAGGRCERIGDAPGYCTAPCVADGDCQLGTGPASTLVCASGWCVPP